MLTAAAAPSAWGQVVWYVDVDAAPGGDGRSWATAMDRLESALLQAGSADEIWLAEGVYRPGGPGERGRSFEISQRFNGLAIYGGFRGTERNRDERDPRRFRAILSGDLLGDDGPGFSNRSDNTITVVQVHGGANEFILLDGVTVRGGFNDQLGASIGGAGIAVRSQGRLHLNACLIEDNWCVDEGGGLHLASSGSMRLTDVGVRGNRADGSGGGCYASRGVEIDGCEFEGNVTSRAGGAIYTYSSNGTVITRSVFRGNEATDGGGVWFCRSGRSTQFVNNLVIGNSAIEIGAALYFWDNCTADIVNCTFLDNWSAVGGVIATNSSVRVWESDVRVVNCVLRDDCAEVRVADASTVTVDFSIIARGYPGIGNVNINPLLDPVSFAPLPGSPCIDAGRNADIIAFATDALGNPRRLDDPGTPDRGEGEAPLVDIGAFEFQGTTPRSMLLLTPPEPVAGEALGITLSAGRPAATAWVLASLRDTGLTYIESLGLVVELGSPQVVGESAVTNANGEAEWNVITPLNLAGRSISLQAAQRELKSELVTTLIREP